MEHRDWWTHLVLTFAQRDWPSETLQAKAGVECWAKLRKRLTREFGTFQYVQTWERHRKRGFHAHVAITSLSIFQEASQLPDPSAWAWLTYHAAESGFGKRCWADPLEKRGGAFAGYLTKLSRELTGAGPKSQVPTQAPPHFRRLRASRGLLPPCHKSEYTGHLVKCPLECWTALTLGDENAPPRSRRRFVSGGIKER